MYTISIRERFTSFLRLEFSENDEGYDLYHNYLIEVAVSGEELDESGFLHNIDDLREELEELIVRWDGALLNDFDEFEDVNPTLEIVARNACQLLAETLFNDKLSEIQVAVWENELDPQPGPSASYRMSLV